MNKIKKYIKFVFNPRKIINDIISINVKNQINSIFLRNFFIPINETKEDDIFIVGFPKSGNTWMQSLVSGLLYGINTEFLSDKLAQEIVPDVHAREYYKRFGQINFFKSHHLPKKNYKKVIYIVRDGRDALTSYFFFNKKLGHNFSLEEMVKYGKGIFPAKWHVHVKEWIKNPYNAEILFIKYEDLLEKPTEELLKICEFTGIERDINVIEKVIAGNTIEQMKRKARKYGGMGHVNWKDEKGEKFFRKGKSGDYKNYFTPELIDAFNAEAFEQLEKFHYL